MPKSFIKNIFQEIRHSIGRFLSILLIVAIGVAFFAGIKASAPDMKYSADQYFDLYNVQDIQVYSTLGLSQEDLERIKKVKDVQNAQAVFTTDALTQFESSEYVIKVISYSPNQEVNQIRLVEGQFPKNENECLIQASSATTKLFGGFQIGDTLTLTSGNDSDLKDTLKNDTYHIVGTCYNPNFLSYELGSSNIGSGSVNSFIYIQDSNVLVDYYTEIDVTVKNAKEINSYNSAYFDLIHPVKKEIEALANSQIKIRIQEKQDELNDASKKLDQELDQASQDIKNGQQEIENGERELADAQNKLVNAKIQLDYGWNQYYEKAALIENLGSIEDALQQIEQGEAQLDELENNKIQLEESITQLTYVVQAFQVLDILKNQFGDLPIFESIENFKADEIISYLNDGKNEIENELNNPDISQEQKENYETIESYIDIALQYSNLLYELEGKNLEDIQTELQNLQDYLDQVNTGIHQIQEGIQKKDELYQQKQALIEGNEELKKAYITLCESQSQYDNGLIQVESASSQLEQAKKKLEEGIQQLNANKKKYKKEIQDAQQTIDELNGEWYVLDRNSHYSYRDYGACAERMDGIAKVFPVFFFLVAALVCMTTMTRMVDEQRNEIGTLKALGYSKTMIASKYLMYALIASIFGSLLGLAIGLFLFPTVIFWAWNMLYNLDAIYYAFQPKLMFMASLSVTGITLLATIYSIQTELRDVPSQLMRPKSGKAGKKIALENIPFIWNRLSFLQKVTARNIFRYKKRFYMTIIGIAGCSALLVAGFGIHDSISDIVHQQYGAIYHYDSSISIKEDSQEFKENLLQIKGIKEIYNEQLLPVTIQMEEKNYSVTVHIIDNTDTLEDFISLQPMQGKENYKLNDQSVVISQKIASKLNVTIGDSLSLKDALDKEIKVKITGIFKNYVGHHIFVTNALYDSWRSYASTTFSYLLKQTDSSKAFEKKLGRKLMELEQVKSVTFYSSLQENFANIISSLSTVVILLVVSAACLAFVVLYNLSNVNISERIREIATIKVLGFLPNEVAAYVNRESLVLTMIGALVGLCIGIGLHHLIMNLAEMDDVMFGRTIKPISFIYAFFLTMLFACIVNVWMRQKLKKVQMVESLKAVE